ncbi:MAG: cupin domain-containing protein [Ruminococcaceae bacterium]|nr:cupin domain-containing protein [Oscillospiraceae bacterium]
MKVYKSEKLIERGKHLHLFSVRDEQRSMPLHTHDFIEIVYIVSGSVLQTVDGVSYHMKRGDIVFLNYGCTHAFSSDEPFSYINVCFSPELLGSSLYTRAPFFSPSFMQYSFATALSFICTQVQFFLRNS